MGKALGNYLRLLRQKKGPEGIKRVAPELSVSYSYLSKLETGTVDPSPETLAKLAGFYGVDVQVLELLTGRIPEEVSAWVQAHPEEVLRMLKDRFGERA